MMVKHPSADIPYRILYVHPHRGKSGPHHCLRELIANLDRTYFSPVVVLSEGNVAANELVKLGAEIRFDSGIRIIPRSFSPVRQLKFWADGWSLTGRLVKLIRTENIRLVHINSEACWVAAFAAKIAGTPAISHLHCLSILSPPPVARIATMVLNKFNQMLIAVSNSVKRAYLSNGASLKLIQTIHNGLNIEVFDPKHIHPTLRSELHVEEDIPLIGMIANFDPRKGHHDFIAACALVLKRVPRAMFVIVGDTNLPNRPHYFQHIQKMAQRLGIATAIRYLGPRNDIPNILASLDVVVQPSLTEAGPIVPIEAMAMERPIVVTDVGGNSEEVVNGQTGLVVPAQNIEAISEAILKLLSNRSLAYLLGRAGRKRVLSMFTAQTYAKKIQKIYQDILANNVYIKSRDNYFYLKN